MKDIGKLASGGSITILLTGLVFASAQVCFVHALRFEVNLKLV